jgi:hypothetical protein
MLTWNPNYKCGPHTRRDNLGCGSTKPVRITFHRDDSSDSDNDDFVVADDEVERDDSDSDYEPDAEFTDDEPDNEEKEYTDTETEGDERADPSLKRPREESADYVPMHFTKKQRCEGHCIAWTD